MVTQEMNGTIVFSVLGVKIRPIVTMPASQFCLSSMVALNGCPQ